MIMARKCLNCESRKGMARFDGETFTINHADMIARVKGLSGSTRRQVSFPKAVEKVIIPDLKNSVDWAPVLQGVDVVIHMAAIAHSRVANDDYSDFGQINWMATQQLAQAAKTAGVDRFVYISSVRAQTGAYSTRPVRETDEAQPTNYYGRSKLAAEQSVRASAVPFTIFRPVVIYGPNPKGNMRTLVRLAKSPVPLPIASFTSRRSVLGIENFISAIIFALNTPATIGEVYIIADSKPMTVGEILAALRENCGSSFSIYVPQAIIRFLLAVGGRKDLWLRLTGDLVVDTSKFESLGWRPAKDTREGLLGMMSADNGESA
jgi:nucleoside-diphosphate-sugar epimerase